MKIANCSKYQTFERLYPDSTHKALKCLAACHHDKINFPMSTEELGHVGEIVVAINLSQNFLLVSTVFIIVFIRISIEKKVIWSI